MSVNSPASAGSVRVRADGDKAVYGDLTLAELELQYSPSSRVDDLYRFLAEYARRSDVARADLPVRVGLRYGTGDRETLDYFTVAKPNAPLHVYIHGGYWQELSKDESAFAAPGFVQAGMNFVALGYGLAPEYRLDEIVAHVRGGLSWLLNRSDELGFDPRQVYLSGSSAGAHLVAMALLPGWTPGGRHPADLFAGAVLLSGIYDLEPLRHTYVNEKIGMDAEVARRNSPILALPDRLPPMIVARGGIETEEFAGNTMISSWLCRSVPESAKTLWSGIETISTFPLISAAGKPTWVPLFSGWVPADEFAEQHRWSVDIQTTPRRIA